MKKAIHDFGELQTLIAESNIVFPDNDAQILPNDKEITSGRIILDVKSTQLFTGRFEEQDLTNFVSTWKRYRNGQNRNLCSQLKNLCRAIILNYHEEVCPIEVMLYTSNVISTSFSDVRLVEDVSEIVYKIWDEYDVFRSSIEHIILTWRWKHVINICALAAAKKADEELLRYIYDNYHHDDEMRYFCFDSLLESRISNFAPDILNEIRDLTGSNTVEKRIGNKFKNVFFNRFPSFIGLIDKDMFSTSSAYVKGIISQMIDDETTYTKRYAKAKSNTERQALLNDGYNKLFNSMEQKGLYDVINMFRLANSQEMSKKLYEKLDIDQSQGLKKSIVNATISYFNTINYPEAIRKISTIDPQNPYYAAGRLVMFHQGIISADELMKCFLSEKRSDQLKVYISGFYGMSQKGNQIQAGSFRYMSQDLDRDELSTAISNYEKLVKKYKHLYDQDMIKLYFEWFGYQTVFGSCRLGIADQISCLNIIEQMIDKSNIKKYDNFLYYIAIEGNFNFTVSSKAKTILKSAGSTVIGLES